MNFRSCATLHGGDPSVVTDAAEQIRALETALRRSEEKLRVALAAAQLGTWERDLVTGEFTASDICRANLGLPRDAPLTFEMLQAMRHPDDLARVSQALARSIETGEDYDVEYRVVRPDGSIGHLIARGHAVHENGRAVRMVGVTLDVTDRERDRKALLELERRQRFLLDLNDRLRSIENPAGILSVAPAMLGSHLGVGRVGFAEVAEDGWLLAEGDWTDGTLPALTDRLNVSDFGPDAAALLGQGRILAVPDLDAESWGTATPLRRGGTRALLSVPILDEGRLAAIVHVHCVQPHRWSSDDENLVVEVAERVWSSVERARAEAHLRISEAKFRTIAEALPAFVWILGVDLKLTYVNERWIRFSGLPPDQALGFSWMDAIHPDDLKQIVSDIRRVIENESAYTVEARYRPPNGAYRWHMIRAEPLRNARGEFVGWCGASVDIHDRKLGEERQDLLIRELHHRVKNTLATVQAIVSSTARTATNMDAFYRSFVPRLVSLAHTHDLLTGDQWQKASLGELLRNELGPYSDPAGTRVVIEGPVVEFPSEFAVPLGMAIHELTTNAAKHGAFSTSEGQVDVRWTVSDDETRPVLHLAWTERNGPPVRPPTRQGFGSRLLRRVLTAQLEAKVDIAYEETGLRCTIAVPIPQGTVLMNPLL
jgi:PAS domain S-box-containing protein